MRRRRWKPPARPILQLVLAGSSREAWQSSSRGLSQSDLAMQVVLPELDGRLLTTAISFKAEQSEVAGLEFARVAHQPAEDGIAAAARSAGAWARLATTPRPMRKLALVLSDYPGAAGQAAHAVGLDAIASAGEILRLLKHEGFDVGDALPENAKLVAALCDAEPAPFLSLADYRRLLGTLDPDASAKIVAAGARLSTTPPSATVISPCASRITASSSPRSSRTAATRSTARRAITILTCRRATPMSPSISGCAR